MPASSGGYLVLARKYRPRTFEDMIGQEAMVRTIANSFAMGRVPHAYMLTGVRGVGKTTTARLLARALNYKTDTVDAPSIKLDPAGVHCQAIMESRHPDVFEMDAASRTGINDIREILDSVRYAPVMARYKIYIIDEVHMLSTAAFNGLLKTLEEPPPHVKFIFATTEIRKVPVTVLSRCQRFDLKRIDTERLQAHLASICEKEGVSIEDDGLALIARAAEGSARDSLSLLDQAMVQKPGETVTVADVREMLGLADRNRVLDLMEAITRGDVKT
ncbi:MAG: DNA polymerase III subunit gamma/tau, partial [Caulobacterales bacterium]